MDRIVVSCGEWKYEKKQWSWVVNSGLGCKTIELNEGVGFEEIVSIVHEDFGMDKEMYKVKLSYVSDSLMHRLPEDTPPIRVTNERQLRLYMQALREEAIRLCVEFVTTSDVDVGGGGPEWEGPIDPFDHTGGRESVPSSGLMQTTQVGVEVVDEGIDDAGRGMRFDCCEDPDGASSDDEDFTVLQRISKEEEDKQKNHLPPKKRASVDVDKSEHAVEIIKRSLEFGVGQIFPTKCGLISKLKTYCVLHRCDFDVECSTKKLLVVKCWVENCGWRLRAACRSARDMSFIIRFFVGEHSCSVTERSNRTRQATPEILGRLYLQCVGGVGPSVVPEQVADSLIKRFGIQVDYWKAHRTLKAARALVLGTPEDSFADLPSYLYMIRRANPGSVVKLEVDEEDRFAYLFISYRASIWGYRFMRKVVVVDGTFLQGKYKGTLLTASMQDGNFQIFPMAFGVVDNESDESWEWFFRQLREVIPDGPGLAIISDRHVSIRNTVGKVYPLAAWGVCTYHLRKNIISRFRGGVFKLFKKAATTYRLEEFNAIFSQIQAQDARLYKYLEEADVRAWSRVHFPGNRYNFTTSNIAESMNHAIYAARSYPIVQLMDSIRAMMTRWFAERRTKALATTTFLTPAIEKLLKKRVHEISRYKVQTIGEHVVAVTGPGSSHLVKLSEKSCSCRRFDVDKIPCVHGVAAAIASGESLIALTDPYYYTSYWLHAYGHLIYPPEAGIQVPPDVVGTVCLPPIVRNPPGRPKKKRFKSWLECSATEKRAKKTTICSRCHRKGHNVRTCVTDLES